MAADLVDAHVHVVDFLQDPADPADLLAAMDRTGIGGAVVFGLPVKKRWGHHEPSRPRYYLDDVDSCYPWSATGAAVAAFVADCASPERLAPLACGVDPTDLDAAARADRLLGEGPFIGVGELLLRHGRLTPLIHGEAARANHPAVIAIAEVCRRHGAPLVIHHNAGSTGQGPTAYLGELEQLLASTDDDLDVVWCHLGTSSEHVAPPPEAVARLLDRHRRLHVDISWAATEVIEPSGHVAPEWIALVADHPDRVLWGSDSVARFDDLDTHVQRLDAFLEELPQPDQQAVRSGNARRLFFDGR